MNPMKMQQRKASTRVLVVGLVLAGISVVLLLVADTIGLPQQAIGALVVVLSIVLFLVGIPVGIAMLGASLLGLFSLGGTRVITSTLESVVYNSSASWSYS